MFAVILSHIYIITMTGSNLIVKLSHMLTNLTTLHCTSRHTHVHSHIFTLVWSHISTVRVSHIYTVTRSHSDTGTHMSTS